MDIVSVNKNKALLGVGGTGRYDWDIVDLYPKDNYFESTKLPKNVELTGKYEHGYKFTDPYSVSHKMVNLLIDDSCNKSMLRIFGDVTSHTISFKWRIKVLEPGTDVFQFYMESGGVIVKETITTSIFNEDWNQYTRDLSDTVGFKKDDVIFKWVFKGNYQGRYILSISDIEIDWTPALSGKGKDVVLRQNPAYKYGDLSVSDGQNALVKRISFDQNWTMPRNSDPEWVDVTHPFYWAGQQFDTGEGGPPILPSMWDDASETYKWELGTNVWDAEQSWGGVENWVLPISPNKVYWKWLDDVIKIRMTIDYNNTFTVYDSYTEQNETVTYEVVAIANWNNTENMNTPVILTDIFTPTGSDFTFEGYQWIDTSWDLGYNSPDPLYRISADGQFTGTDQDYNGLPLSEIFTFATRITNYTGDPDWFNNNFSTYPQADNIYWSENQLFDASFVIKKIEVMANPNPELSDWIDVSEPNLWNINTYGYPEGLMCLSDYSTLDNNSKQYYNNRQSITPTGPDWIYQIDTTRGKILKLNSLAALQENFDKTQEPVNEFWNIFDTIEPPYVSFYPYGGDMHGIAQEVRLLSNTATEIHFTTDGSKPNEESPLYTTPFMVHDTRTIKCFGIDAAGNYSDENWAQMIIDPPDPSMVITSDQYWKSFDDWQQGQWGVWNPIGNYWNGWMPSGGYSGYTYIGLKAKVPFTFQRMRMTVYSQSPLGYCAVSMDNTYLDGSEGNYLAGRTGEFKFSWGPGEFTADTYLIVRATGYYGWSPTTNINRIDVLY
jgi:hypothetical protein